MTELELTKKQIAQEQVVKLIRAVAGIAGATRNGLSYLLVPGALATA